MESIAKIMERYRLTAGQGGMPLSYAELGRRIGVSRTQAENFCKGRSIPSDDAVLRICKETGQSEVEMLVLQHHDRAPDAVRPVWREVLGRLQNKPSQLPPLDSKIVEILDTYQKLPHAGRAALLKIWTMFLKLESSMQEHLVKAMQTWSDAHDALEKALE